MSSCVRCGDAGHCACTHGACCGCGRRGHRRCTTGHPTVDPTVEHDGTHCTVCVTGKHPDPAVTHPLPHDVTHAALREQIGIELAAKLRAMKHDKVWARNSLLEGIARYIEQETRQ